LSCHDGAPWSEKLSHNTYRKQTTSILFLSSEELFARRSENEEKWTRGEMIPGIGTFDTRRKTNHDPASSTFQGAGARIGKKSREFRLKQ
jgi:hypothetical protein